jgi:hypothetical protein
MDTIQHNLARLYNRDEIGITIVQHKHTKILGLKGKRQISSLQSAERGSLVEVVTFMSSTGHYSSISCISKKKNETRTDEWHTAWINPCLPSHGVHKERYLFQWFLHSIKHTKPTKEDPIILVMDGHYSHTRNMEVIHLTRQNYIDVICLPPHSSHKIQPLDKTLIGPLKHSTSKKLKNDSDHAQGEWPPSTKLANYSEMHTIELQ